MKHAGETGRDAWATINAETERAGAALAVTGDKLDITLAKLEHRPGNFLKLELDEDRKALADVGAEAEQAQKKIAEMFIQHGVSNVDQWKDAALDALKRVTGTIVGWHTFRHTYRSWLDETGAPMGVQQKPPMEVLCGLVLLDGCGSQEM